MDCIDTTKIALDEFIDLLLNESREEFYPKYHFPTEEHFNDFILKIDTYTDKEIKSILRKFIIHNCTFGTDLFYRKQNISKQTELSEAYIETEYYKRLMSLKYPNDCVWEGLTWVLDLLPHSPNEAIKAIGAYFLANCPFLPDDHLIALGECTTLIRAKYINIVPVREQILNLNPLDFEMLVAKLFAEIGYDAKLTKRSHDGGMDIIANRNEPVQKEILIIQCKRFENKVGVKYIRDLLGVVTDKKANKGTLITTSFFTKDSIKFAKNNPRIELIDYNTLAKLFNQYLGCNWINNIDNLILKYKTDIKVCT